MNRPFMAVLIGAVLTLPFIPARAADTPREPYGIDLEGFAYPYPVSLFPVSNDGEQLKMAYMDIGASGQPTAALWCCCTGAIFRRATGPP